MGLLIHETWSSIQPALDNLPVYRPKNLVSSQVILGTKLTEGPLAQYTEHVCTPAMNKPVPNNEGPVISSPYCGVLYTRTSFLKHGLVNMPADSGTRCLARQCHARYAESNVWGGKGTPNLPMPLCRVLEAWSYQRHAIIIVPLVMMKRPYSGAVGEFRRLQQACWHPPAELPGRCQKAAPADSKEPQLRGKLC